MAEVMSSECQPLPTNPDDFGQDDRISFSRLDNKHIAVLDDGQEMEFDTDLRRWIHTVDEALIEQQQQGYVMAAADPGGSSTIGNGNGNGNSNNSTTHDNEDDGRKAKQAKINGKKSRQGAGKDGARQPKPNTAVYVTGLPLDATVDEVAELFSRKCGVIAEEIDSGRPRIKMYTDAQARFKGDALIVFFKPQSVDMALMLLDDTDFRISPSGLGSGKMRIQVADSSYKKTQYHNQQQQQQQQQQHQKDQPGDATSAADGNGENGNSTGPSSIDKYNKASRASNQDKVKVIRKTQKLSAKLADWDDDAMPDVPLPGGLQPEALRAKGGKWDKVVILRHMFTMAELNEDPAALLDIKEDVRDECAKLGQVTNVVLYDLEEEGIVSVRFQTADAANACVRMMHGRAFDGRTVEAFFATGRERFRKSKKGDDVAGGDDGDEEEP